MTLKMGRVVARIVKAGGADSTVIGYESARPEFWPIDGYFDPDKLGALPAEDSVVCFVDKRGVMRGPDGEEGVKLLVGSYMVQGVPHVRRIFVTEEHTDENPLDLAKVAEPAPYPDATYYTIPFPEDPQEAYVLAWDAEVSKPKWRTPDVGPPGPPGKDAVFPEVLPPSPLKIVSVSNYYIVGDDSGRTLVLESSDPTTINLVASGLPVNTRVDILCVGSGDVTISGDNETTILPTPVVKVRTQYSAVSLIVLAGNRVLVIGDLEA